MTRWAGKRIDIRLTDERHVVVRDYGRDSAGVVGKVKGTMNTGAKYDNEVFKKVVGAEWCGLKAVERPERTHRGNLLPRGQRQEGGIMPVVNWWREPSSTPKGEEWHAGIFSALTIPYSKL